LGYVCEKVDESAFTGNIVERITDGIKNAEFVIADLSLERPNVYLEVGFAWGLRKPVILVAKDGQRLHFDLSQHKCIFYRTIGKLSEQLESMVLKMFGPGGPQEDRHA
jgi:nucleoside 2-deoxyribosyltransferase